jgi:hypothetical protein
MSKNQPQLHQHSLVIGVGDPLTVWQEIFLSKRVFRFLCITQAPINSFDMFMDTFLYNHIFQNPLILLNIEARVVSTMPQMPLFQGKNHNIFF